MLLWKVIQQLKLRGASYLIQNASFQLLPLLFANFIEQLVIHGCFGELRNNLVGIDEPAVSNGNHRMFGCQNYVHDLRRDGGAVILQ